MKKKNKDFPEIHISDEDRKRYLEEFMKPIDFSKMERKGIFINLDPEIIHYFKSLAEEDGRGYQVLIRMALEHYMQNGLKPKNVWGK